ncbi:MAG: T9SS type A sorting domain-containing protein [Candidatus Kapabacteria bacterium]|nr:T9SS type A sorting domain-containing protein [Ignavibacteriota bacterium]MCW5883713.1 T9SS type A sorting domain-containing protein [Candidatus Kapabacteria bacterium]
MKNSTITPLFILSSMLLIIIIGLTVPNEKFRHSDPEESGPTFTKERHRYFWERYQDPATGLIPANARSRELEFVKNRWLKNYKSNNALLLSNDTWSRRGPFEVGGRTRGLDIDVRNENIIIAGGVSGGMWKSIDNGLTWDRTSLPHQLQSVTCLVQDKRPGKEDNWYYGTGEYWGNSAGIFGDGVYKSTNNGDSWEVLPSTSTSRVHSWDQPFDFCWNIVTNPAAPDSIDEVVVATASMGVLRSFDGGTTWNNVLGSNARALFSDVAVTSEGVYYATLSSDGAVNTKGIFRSEDGVRWTNITPPNFPLNFRRIVIGIAPSDESQVYFLGETPGYGKLTFNSRGDSLWHSLWKYDFQGSSGSVVLGEWEDRSLNLPKPEPTRGQMNSQQGYNLVIKVKPDNPDVLFIGAVAMYRSDSGFKGTDWAWIGGTCPDESCDYFFRYTNHHADVHEIVFSNSNPDILYTGSDGGVHKTLDNMSENVEWISLNNGYFTTQFYTVAIDHGEKLSREIIGGLQDNGTLLSRNTDMVNNEWSNPLRADGFYCKIPDGAPYYYASQNGTWQPKIKIYRIVHDENGNNVTSTRIDPIGGEDFIWNTPFILDPNDNNIMYLAGGKMLWRNNDLSGIPFENNTVDSISINWDSLSHTRIDYINTAPLGERITAVSVSKNPANIVYYGTSRGKLYKLLNANEGNPEPINVTGSNFPIGNISSIAFDPDNADNVVISFSNYNILSIFMTADGGQNWTSISGNLEENRNGTGAGPGVNWVNILKVNGVDVYFAGTTAGLFTTAFLNGDATAWQMEGPDVIGNMVVHMIDARQQDGYVAIGTHGTGVFEGFYKNLPGKPLPVKLSEPLDETMHVKSNVELSWQPISETGFYELEIAKDPNFIDVVYSVSGIADTKHNWINVEQGRIDYYWRVRNSGPGGLSDFSEVWKFTSALKPPKILFPNAGTDQVMTGFTFEWENVEYADQYRIQVAQGFGIMNPFIDTVVSHPYLEVDNFERNKRYVWRLASIEDDNQGEFGDEYHFITRHPASVNDFDITGGINISIEPNPVTDFAYINLTIETTVTGKLMIYDINGRILEIFAEQSFMPGNMSIPIDASKLNSGLYNIVFITNKQKIYKKIQVIK